VDNLIYNIASFNIRYDTPLDKENSWVNRKDNVLKMLSYYSWDVFGLQEVRDHQLSDIKVLSEYNYEGIGREEGSSANEACPVFYRKDIFQKEAGGTFWLSLTPEVSSRSWNSDCPRICTWVKLKDKRNNKIVVFINTHFDHMSEEARVESSKMITKWIENEFGGLPVILVGDFNSDPQETCYKEISSKLLDAFKIGKVPHYGPIGTFNYFEYDIEWKLLKEIDHIFVNNHVIVKKTATIVDSFDRSFPSDHFPIMASIELSMS
jgi:endonuclease/exonuclease/phosphatase family metal-dependent hydrolase